MLLRNQENKTDKLQNDWNGFRNELEIGFYCLR